MVIIIVNKWAFRLRNSGVLESSSVTFKGVGEIAHPSIENDWMERTPELTDLSGADQSIVYGSLLQLSATLPKFGERQPHREWVEVEVLDASKPML